MTIKKGVYLIKTLSGSVYKLVNTDNQKWLERVPSQESSSLRRDNERIIVYEVLNLAVGKPALFAIEPLGLGNVTLRETTTVLEMIVVDQAEC
ncbi:MULTISPECIES: hypothetical protein [Lacticaseibacillus]|jgi:hypothetical protein|uniref:Uncharacterized protein n=1 Tax=Lacticaseibacillus huelsenbergensis TaxID=3035291 RepID=A0ABY8DS46_9LACO|nr:MULTISPECIES: hypothetical protein [Lacticaseibacillus]MBI6596993.1 hypothetical protein [Lacticaseibacillus casei]MBO1480745.1 hypothetical protein [Lacticaseibacillus casei]MBO2415969.1 hypothetical protein [Lacticaseibacillus casei]MCK2080422.1 hypothetical protein [Lacticaseibacillus casei]MDG3061502.1 hypothetical protein [Lacticaseibacillus sp. BCRC 81376]